MFDTVLVAGRGEYARRVISLCQSLGIKAVSVHATDDAKAPHATEADESVLLGDAAAYEDEVAVVEAAQQARAQAVHPGSGPLAGSATFPVAVRAAGLAWIHPEGDLEQQLRTAAGEWHERTGGSA